MRRYIRNVVNKYVYANALRNCDGPIFRKRKRHKSNRRNGYHTGTTTLANMRATHDALVKDGWDIIGTEKHKEFVVIVGVRPIEGNKKNDPYADTVVFSSKDVNNRGDTIITKTVFRNGIPIKSYFNIKKICTTIKKQIMLC